jgi:hypothetical protein
MFRSATADLNGGAIGSTIGGIVDNRIFGEGARNNVVVGPRLQDLRVQSSGYGSVIPRVYGKARLAGNVIWMRGFEEETRSQTQRMGGGGTEVGCSRLQHEGMFRSATADLNGGGRRRPTTTTVSYVYFCDLAVALCEGPIVGINKMFADGNAIGREHYAARRVYLGTAAQPADPLIAPTEALTPAYRGLAYVVLERFAITPFGNRLPNFSFELTA